jgi:MFS family permease
MSPAARSGAVGRGSTSRRRRPIRSLFIGTAVSRIGDSVTLVALIWIMLERTHSAGGVALVQFAYTILIPIGGLLVGGVLDRFRVVPVMIGDAFVKCAVVTAVFIAEITGFAVVPATLVAALYLGLTWMVGGAGLPTVIAGALAPDEHPQANMFDSLAYSFSAVVGPLLAGLLISLISAPGALIVGSICSATYGLLLVDVRGDLLSHVPPASVGAIGIRGIAQGFRLVLRSQLLLSLTLMFVSLNAIATLYAVVLPVYADQTLHAGAAGYTLLLSVNSVGAMTGIVIGRWLTPRIGVSRAIVGSTALGGLLFLPMLAVNSLAAAALVLFAEGLVANAYGPWVQTLRMRVIPPEVRSRAFGSIRTMTNSMSPLGALGAGALLPILGIDGVWIVIAVWWIVTAAALAVPGELRRSRA